MSAQFKSHLALFVVQVMYGANYVVAKGLMPDVVGPNGFILIRVIGAVALFWAILSFMRERIDRKDFVRLAICGFFGVALNQLMFFNGLMLTSPLNAPVIMTTTPILVLALSALILREKVRLVQIIGVIVGGIGSVFFILMNEEGGFASSTGDILILVNATSYSFYLVLVKPLMQKYKPLTVISWVFTFGLLYVLLWLPSGQELSLVAWSEVSWVELAQILFVVIGVTFTPYLLNVYAMRQLSPSIAAVYIYLQPVIAAGFVLLMAAYGLTDYRDDLSWMKGLCAIAVFIGVYLVIKSPKEEVQEGA